MNKTWRDHAQRVIQGVLKEHPGASKEELKKLLRAAYPFGERKHHPYKVWCAEVRNALGTGKKPDYAKLETWNRAAGDWH